MNISNENQLKMQSFGHEESRAEELIFRIGECALQAMLYEVAATPKPGLVDRANSGAHKDMDFFTFMSSAAALRGTFEEMAQAGYLYGKKSQGVAEGIAEDAIRNSGEHHSRSAAEMNKAEDNSSDNVSLEDLLPELKRIGLEGEKRMFRATGGVNTHKGMIFSLGLLCGSAGYLLGEGNAEQICETAARIIAGVCRRELPATGKNDPASKESHTHGEKVYLQHGYTGARGEAESGFATVREFGLPVYRKLRETDSADLSRNTSNGSEIRLGVNADINAALVQTLLHIIAHNVDTNIIARHGVEMLEYAQQQAAKALQLGGMYTEAGQDAIRSMDEDFIRRRISPGGSADLTALTHFLYEAEHL